MRALQTLKKDEDIMVLPADKGKATVVLDKTEYDSKIEAILSDSKTYEPLKKDPTNIIKNKFLNIIKPWKKNNQISKRLYKQIYPTAEQPPKFYGLPKIHKKDVPLRPIVSGNSSVLECVAKHLSKILNSVKGKNPHGIKNSEDFVKKVMDLKVPSNGKLVSFDVSALFTSIPIDFALLAIRQKLSSDDSWKSETELDMEQILTLLELCLSSTYFVFRGQFYKQKFGAPMGSPISPGVADLCMEVFEEDMLLACPDHLRPQVWFRYVDDTFTILQEDNIETFTTFLNSRNQHIQFTREVEENNQIPFLDVCVHLLEDGNLKTTVYRKPTHTDQYLNWNSNHHLDHKRSVVRTLMNRVHTHVSDPEDQVKEKEHVKKVLSANGYADWALEVPNQSDKSLRATNKEASQPANENQERTPQIGLPYIQGLSEELQRIFKSHGVHTYHKPFNTIRSLLVNPKDKTDKKDKCGTIYNIPCSSCDDFYIGETKRKLGVRYNEHSKSDKESAVLEHIKKTGHSISMEDVTILASEPRDRARKIKEALEIYKRQPSLNNDQGLEINPVLLQLLKRRDSLSSGRGGTPVGTRDRANSL